MPPFRQLDVFTNKKCVPEAKVGAPSSKSSILNPATASPNSTKTINSLKIRNSELNKVKIKKRCNKRKRKSYISSDEESSCSSRSNSSYNEEGSKKKKSGTILIDNKDCVMNKKTQCFEKQKKPTAPLSRLSKKMFEGMKRNYKTLSKHKRILVLEDDPEDQIEDQLNGNSDDKLDGKSYHKQTGKSDHKQEGKFGHKREGKSDRKQEDKSGHKREDKSDHKQENKSDHKQEYKSGHKREGKSDHKQEEKSGHKREGISDHKQEGKSDRKQEGKSDHKQEGKSDNKQEGKSDHKQEGKSDVNLEGKCDNKKDDTLEDKSETSTADDCSLKILKVSIKKLEMNKQEYIVQPKKRDCDSNSANFEHKKKQRKKDTEDNSVLKKHKKEILKESKLIYNLPWDKNVQHKAKLPTESSNSNLDNSLENSSGHILKELESKETFSSAKEGLVTETDRNAETASTEKETTKVKIPIESKTVELFLSTNANLVNQNTSAITIRSLLDSSLATVPVRVMNSTSKEIVDLRKMVNSVNKVLQTDIENSNSNIVQNGAGSNNKQNLAKSPTIQSAVPELNSKPTANSSTYFPIVTITPVLHSNVALQSITNASRVIGNSQVSSTMSPTIKNNPIPLTIPKKSYPINTPNAKTPSQVFVPNAYPILNKTLTNYNNLILLGRQCPPPLMRIETNPNRPLLPTYSQNSPHLNKAYLQNTTVGRCPAYPHRFPYPVGTNNLNMSSIYNPSGTTPLPQGPQIVNVPKQSLYNPLNMNAPYTGIFSVPKQSTTASSTSYVGASTVKNPPTNGVSGIACQNISKADIAAKIFSKTKSSQKCHNTTNANVSTKSFNAQMRDTRLENIAYASQHSPNNASGCGGILPRPQISTSIFSSQCSSCLISNTDSPTASKKIQPKTTNAAPQFRQKTSKKNTYQESSASLVSNQIVTNPSILFPVANETLNYFPHFMNTYGAKNQEQHVRHANFQSNSMPANLQDKSKSDKGFIRISYSHCCSFLASELMHLLFYNNMMKVLKKCIRDSEFLRYELDQIKSKKRALCHNVKIFFSKHYIDPFEVKTFVNYFTDFYRAKNSFLAIDYNFLICFKYIMDSSDFRVPGFCTVLYDSISQYLSSLVFSVDQYNTFLLQCNEYRRLVTENVEIIDSHSTSLVSNSGSTKALSGSHDLHQKNSEPSKVLTQNYIRPANFARLLNHKAPVINQISPSGNIVKTPTASQSAPIETVCNDQNKEIFQLESRSDLPLTLNRNLIPMENTDKCTEEESTKDANCAHTCTQNEGDDSEHILEKVANIPQETIPVAAPNCLIKNEPMVIEPKDFDFVSIDSTHVKLEILNDTDCVKTNKEQENSTTVIKSSPLDQLSNNNLTNTIESRQNVSNSSHKLKNGNIGVMDSSEIDICSTTHEGSTLLTENEIEEDILDIKDNSSVYSSHSAIYLLDENENDANEIICIDDEEDTVEMIKPFVFHDLKVDVNVAENIYNEEDADLDLEHEYEIIFKKEVSMKDEIIDCKDEVPVIKDGPRNFSNDSGIVDVERANSYCDFWENRICICGKKSDLLCHCETAIYCSTECQNFHWDVHRKTCSYALNNVF